MSVSVERGLLSLVRKMSRTYSGKSNVTLWLPSALKYCDSLKSQRTNYIYIKFNVHVPTSYLFILFMTDARTFIVVVLSSYVSCISVMVGVFIQSPPNMNLTSTAAH